VGAGVWMLLIDRLRSNEGGVRAEAVCKHRDGWRAFPSHLGTRRIELYDVVLRASGLALLESVKKWDTLQTHAVTKGAGISYSQAAS
jgi:hypothetical protein